MKQRAEWRGLARRLGAMLFASMLLSPGPARATHDQLIIGVAQFPSSLNPDIDPEVIKSYVLDFALRPITALDPDWNNACMLCTAVPTLDNGMVRLEPGEGGQTGMAVTVKLRPGLLWADGAPLTTADLAFTAKVGQDARSGFASSHYWTQISRIDVIDAQTAVMHLKAPDALFDRLPSLLPEHIEAAAYARVEAPGDYAKQSLYNRAPTTPGLYNGPYRITSYQSGQGIVLEPSEHWAGTQPKLRRIIIKPIENTSALQANLMSGDIDMAPGDAPGLTIDQVLTLRRQHPDDFTYVFRPALTYEHVDLNLDNPILKDVRVRRALLYALDRKTMVGKMFEGLQPVADSFVNPLDPVYSSKAPHYPFDPAKARALLAEAGWTPSGDDGICRNAAGTRLSLEFGTTTGNRLRELQQQVMQSQWKAVCVEITIHNEPARTFFGETLKHRSFGALTMYAWTTSVAGPPRQMLGSDMVPTAANGYGGTNFPNFRNAAMDAGIKTVETELDTPKRMAAWADIQRIYADQLPVLPLFFRAEPYVLPKWLKGVTPTGSSDYSSLWAENWRSE